MDKLNRLLKKSFNVVYKHGFHEVKPHGGNNRMLKKASSKAAGTEAPGAYMEVREEAERLRTQLVAFFSILLKPETLLTSSGEAALDS